MGERVSCHHSGPWSALTRLECAVQIIKVLGEGGFSFVYLAQDEHSGVSHSDISSLAWAVMTCLPPAAIRTEEDTMSERCSERKGSTERGRGVSSV